MTTLFDAIWTPQLLTVLSLDISDAGDRGGVGDDRE